MAFPRQARQCPGFPGGAVAVGANGTGDLLIFVPGREGACGSRLHLWSHGSHECRPTAVDVG